jgi:translation initiation factor 2B subunit (eIF-2B alpha/beta/delta family)
MKKKKSQKIKDFTDRSNYCIATCEWIASKAFNILSKLDQLENNKFDISYSKKFDEYIKELKHLLNKSDKEMQTMNNLEKELKALQNKK